MFSVISHVVFENPMLAKCQGIPSFSVSTELPMTSHLPVCPFVLVRLLGLPLIMHIAKHIVNSV